MAETTASTSSLMQEYKIEAYRLDLITMLSYTTNTGDVPTTVEIPDSFGYSEYRLNKQDTLDLLERLELDGSRWIFASGQMMQPSQLAEADWETVGTVRIVPALVGGRVTEGDST